jgi:hypothetical protein
LTTAGDIIYRALEDVGVIGVGQTPLAEDMNYGLARLNAMIGQLNRRRGIVFHTVDIACMTTGLNVYSVGLGQQFNIPRPGQLENGCYFRQYFGGGSGGGGSGGGDFNSDFNQDFSTGSGSSAVSATGRGSPNSNYPFAGSDFNTDFNQDFGPSGLASQPPGNAIDYPLTVLNSREDWNRIAMKNLSSWPGYIFYDPAYTQMTAINGVPGITYPAGFIYINPVPRAGQFELHILVKDVLATYATPQTVLNTPPEYEEAFEYNLAIRFAVKYNVPASQEVLALARSANATLRSANTQVPLAQLPSGLAGQGARYSILSDRA